ncbi:MAG: hypothetical protein ABI039_06270 [Vicinamibacterales bacterium]
MATYESLTAAIDQVIDYFNVRRLDLPDGFFERQTQFLLNGAPFETLLSATPNDPLILMLARGPAGFRFTAKALQYAVPDARLDRGAVATDGDPFKLTLQLWLSGTLRGSGEKINSLVAVTLRLAPAGHVGIAEALIDAGDLERIRQARITP